MKLPFWEPGIPTGAILGPVLEDVIDELCERKQIVLIATPYLHYESRFMERNGQMLKVRATMNRDAVKHSLGDHALRLRFPWALVYYSGPTRILGYEQEEHQRSLTVELPNHLVIDERRRVYRVSHLGHSTGALGSEEGTILRIIPNDLSTLGVSAFSLDSIPAEKFRTGRNLNLSLTLDPGIVVVCGARISHSEGQNLGLRFHPALPEQERSKLSDWLLPRQQEAMRRWENRAELRARAEQSAQPKVAPRGVLLVSSDVHLASQVASSLMETMPLRTTAPVMTSFKEAMLEPPQILLIDAGGLDMEGRYRIRTLLDRVPIKAPVIVIKGTMDTHSARLLASDIKAVTSLERNLLQGTFFRNLVQGLVENHAKSEAL